MKSGYTHKNLVQVQDAAPGLDLAEWQESRFAGGDLGVDDMGVTHHRIKPDTRQGFAHRHEHAEEVYVVLAGSGRVKLGDDVVELRRLDALRVSPDVLRTWEAGPDGLELLAFGTRVEGDADFVPGWWTD